MRASFYLPSPSERGLKSLEEAIARRRSVRDFSAKAVTPAQLSQILWAAQGITDATNKLRTAPSAGATYPLDIFTVCGKNSVEGIDEGVYHYEVARHSLTRHHKGDVRVELSEAALNQEFIYQAPVNLVICAVYERTAARYGARADRYINMEVGHAGQNIYLQATALGLATVAVGAFYDDQVRDALRLDKQYKPLYIMPLGFPFQPEGPSAASV